MTKRYTVVFEGDIRKLVFNPTTADDTKFGKVVASSADDALARVDALEVERDHAIAQRDGTADGRDWHIGNAADFLARVTELEETLASIHDFAVGNGDVCEIIAKRARAVLTPRAVENYEAARAAGMEEKGNG